jgi:hypothetical protein
MTEFTEQRQPGELLDLPKAQGRVAEAGEIESILSIMER